jgi:hypothetical protein
MHKFSIATLVGIIAFGGVLSALPSFAEPSANGDGGSVVNGQPKPMKRIRKGPSQGGGDSVEKPTLSRPETVEKPAPKAPDATNTGGSGG